MPMYFLDSSSKVRVQAYDQCEAVIVVDYREIISQEQPL